MNKKEQKCIEEMQKSIDEKLNNIPFDERKKVFIQLEEMAHEEMNGKCQELFLKALYTAKSTFDVVIVLQVERALKE